MSLRQRFNYRTPGLFVLAVRVFQLAAPEVRPERPEYAGCKTWVELDTGISVDNAVPVLSDADFAEQLARINP